MTSPAPWYKPSFTFRDGVRDVGSIGAAFVKVSLAVLLAPLLPIVTFALVVIQSVMTRLDPPNR